MWTIVPVKRFATGKSRLAPVLSAPQRRELVRLMLGDVLHALGRAHAVERVIVLTSDPDVSSLVRRSGIETRPDAREGDLNRSLKVAVHDLPDAVHRVLILPSDVPTVSTADINVLAEKHVAGTLMVPAAVDGGTNALLTERPLAIELRFGESSMTRHLASARRNRVEAKVLVRSGLARDIDRPADLLWLARSPHSGRASAYVRELLQQRRRA